MVQWTEKLRPCAEALYIVLFENHSQVGGIELNISISFLLKLLLSRFSLFDCSVCASLFQLLGPVVVSILQEAMNGCPTSTTEITPGLLLKDAAYGAAAYVYYELSNYLSFKDWLDNTSFYSLYLVKIRVVH